MPQVTRTLMITEASVTGVPQGMICDRKWSHAVHQSRDQPVITVLA
jgi:hypothetical protein